MTQFPLRGVTVLELAGNLPGPYCGRLLADMGARIIKVESPRGDAARQFPDLFARLNHGKESIVLDLRQEPGRQRLLRLTKGADAVIESSRPGVAKKLGTDFPALVAVNPGILYCSITGFGGSSPWASLPAHDLNIQAFTGLTRLFAKSYAKDVVDLPLADFVAALYATLQIVSWLPVCRSTRQGHFIDAAMASGVAHMMSLWQGATNLGSARTASSLLPALPHYGLFRCRDGKNIAVGIVDEQHFWQELCDLIGGDFRYYRGLSLRRRIQLGALLQLRLRLAFRQRSCSAWIDLMVRRPVPLPVCPEHSAHELINIEAFNDLRSSSADASYISSPMAADAAATAVPALGADTEKLLAEFP